MKKSVKEQTVEYLRKIKTINVKPNDVIVVMCDIPLTISIVDMIKKDIQKIFPKNKCVITPIGFDIGVLKEAE